MLYATHLLDRWERATGQELHEGLGWYRGEAEHICRLVDLYAPTVEHGKALVAIAALSPRTTWEKLVGAFGPWLRDPAGHKLPAFSGAVRKAEEILAGRQWLPDARTSPKTHNFARALLGDPFAVTLDMWMMRAMELPEAELQPASYTTLADAVRSAAAAVEVAPRDFQAVVWVVERGPSGIH